MSKEIKDAFDKVENLFSKKDISYAYKENETQEVVNNLLQSIGIQKDISCFDTGLVSEIKAKAEENNYKITKEQNIILNRVQDVIDRKSNALLKTLKNVKLYNSVEPHFNRKQDETRLIGKHTLHLNELDEILNQDVGTSILRKIANVMIKDNSEGNNINTLSKQTFKKLINHKNTTPELLKDILSINNSNMQGINDLTINEYKKEIIKSGKAYKEDIESLLKEPYGTLWQEIADSSYLDKYLIFEMLSKGLSGNKSEQTIIFNIMKDRVLKRDNLDEETKKYINKIINI